MTRRVRGRSGKRYTGDSDSKVLLSDDVPGERRPSKEGCFLLLFANMLWQGEDLLVVMQSRTQK